MDQRSKRRQDDGRQASPNKRARTRSPPNLSSRISLTPTTTFATPGSSAANTASGEIPRPSRREDFEVAIICALPLEYDAVSFLFDEFWDGDGDPYGRATGDRNTYTTGRISSHNVVLTLLPRMERPLLLV